MTSAEAVVEGTFEETPDYFVSYFDRFLRRYVFFTLVFVFFIAAELISIIVFFPFLMKSSLLAFGFALLFFTVFSFWIFRMHHQTSRDYNFNEFKNQVLKSFKNSIQFREGVPQDHLALAAFCQKLSDSMVSKELHLYKSAFLGKPFKSFLTQFSCWWHWDDVFQMRALLLKESVKEHIRVIKFAPTSFEVHTALANAYILLAALYGSTKQTLRSNLYDWMISGTTLQKMDQQFVETSKKAIEEFKILKDFSPNDPWVHLQLAYSYQDLKMVPEEISEYEIVLKMTPDDADLLFRLGSLYFKRGENGKGLKIYEDLKKLNAKKSELLISLYGS